MDASKEYGFGVVAYHFKGDPDATDKQLRRSDIEPLLFMSKVLSTAKGNYWPTELEVACLVWAIRKIHHWVKSARNVIVWTDHSATPGIVKQTTLNSSNTDKLNMRLVRASQYLSQYTLDVRWKPGKQHVVPDALSRLQAASLSSRTNVLDHLSDETPIYHTTTV